MPGRVNKLVKVGNARSGDLQKNGGKDQIRPNGRKGGTYG